MIALVLVVGVHFSHKIHDDAKGFERALFLWPYRAQDVVTALRLVTRAS